MTKVKDLQEEVIKFRDKRDWKKFHNPKDSAVALVFEAVEVLECFRWKDEEEIKEYLEKHKDKVGDELSDVLFWVLLMSHDLGLDIVKAFHRKMKENAQKYPVRKSKGKNIKYTEL